MRHALLLSCFALMACSLDFLGSGEETATTTPTAAQVAYCRSVMYIRPELEIEPLGHALMPGLDDVIRFKFRAKTDDPSLLFDPGQVDATTFAPGLAGASLEIGSPQAWWDVASQQLTGARFTVPPPDSPGTRGLAIGHVDNGDGTLTVYVLWHET
ncbi:MAG: hypothetical protein AAF533_12945 [Acidobacteriota bacterium]